MNKNRSKVREFFDRLINNDIIRELRERPDRNDDWCQEIAIYGVAVFSFSPLSSANDRNTQKIYLSSDDELAHFMLTNSLDGLKMHLETDVIAFSTFEPQVTKLLVSEVQRKQAFPLKFECQLGNRYVGFEGEISPTSMSDHKYQPCIQQPAV